jgi:hypothetical protein
MERPGSVTLKLAAAIAAVLYRLRPLLVVLGLVSVGWFIVAVLDTDAASTTALLPLTLLLWVGLALSVASTLPRLPPAVVPGDGLLLRIKKRWRLAAYGLAFAAMLLLTGIVLAVSWRVVGLLLSKHV